MISKHEKTACFLWIFNSDDSFVGKKKHFVNVCHDCLVLFKLLFQFQMVKLNFCVVIWLDTVLETWWYWPNIKEGWLKVARDWSLIEDVFFCAWHSWLDWMVQQPFLQHSRVYSSFMHGSRCHHAFELVASMDVWFSPLTNIHLYICIYLYKRIYIYIYIKIQIYLYMYLHISDVFILPMINGGHFPICLRILSCR